MSSLRCWRSSGENRQYIFAPGWHADVTWQKTPVLGSILYGVEIPEHGGDTLFANQYLAYETLSEGMRSMLNRLHGVHSSAEAYGEDADKLTKVDLIKLDREEAVKGRAEHPVVRTHPETGRKALYVHAGYTFSLKDMTGDESKPLLEYLLTTPRAPSSPAASNGKKAHSLSGTTAARFTAPSTTTSASAAAPGASPCRATSPSRKGTSPLEVRAARSGRFWVYRH